MDRGLVASPNVEKDSLCNLLASPNVDEDSLCILLILNCGLLASPSMDKETINDLGSPIVDRAPLPLASHIVDCGLLASSSVGKESLASVEEIILQQKVRIEDLERSCHISLKVSLNCCARAKHDLQWRGPEFCARRRGTTITAMTARAT